MSRKYRMGHNYVALVVFFVATLTYSSLVFVSHPLLIEGYIPGKTGFIRNC